MKTYVVKSGNKYADGGRGWTSDQRKAFRFTDEFAEPYTRKWAQGHADTFRIKPKPRVVRLRKRSGR